jgi:hypothetical protein
LKPEALIFSSSASFLHQKIKISLQKKSTILVLTAHGIGAASPSLGLVCAADLHLWSTEPVLCTPLGQPSEKLLKEIQTKTSNLLERRANPLPCLVGGGNVKTVDTRTARSGY